MYNMGQAAVTRSAERSPRAEERRRAILDATLRVIASGGTDSVTHRRVAAEARVPLGSTTYYFASREELLRQAFCHYLRDVASSLDELEREIPPVDPPSLVSFLVEMARREFTTPDLVQAEYELILYAARDAELAAELHAWDDRLESRLAKFFGRHGARCPTDAARSVSEMMRGFELSGLTRPDASYQELERRLASVVDALTNDNQRSGRVRRKPS